MTCPICDDECGETEADCSESQRYRRRGDENARYREAAAQAMALAARYRREGRMAAAAECEAIANQHLNHV